MFSLNFLYVAMPTKWLHVVEVLRRVTCMRVPPLTTVRYWVTITSATQLQFPGVAVRVAVCIGVLVGGTGVFVAVLIGVLVEGTCVLVGGAGVFVDGTVVLLGGTGVLVCGTGVLVGGGGVLMVGMEVEVEVLVGGSGVALGVI